MKKIGNKFIIGAILIIIFIIISQVYTAYSQSNRDTNSYLSVITGNATLNDIRLVEETKSILTSGDKIRVIGESSLAVIEWGDGSMTRLGGNTTITINQSDISRDFTTINISFELIAGKTWSNIVSFISSDSSFTQSFNGIEAGVRGTVFDVDLEKQFIHSSNHSVELTIPDGEKIIVSEGSVISLETFGLIEISEYIKNLRNSAWIELNTSLDAEYLNSLKESLRGSFRSSNPLLYLLRFFSPKYAIYYVLDTYENIDDVEKYISELSDEDKIKIYDDVLYVYQELNFVSPDDEQYDRKMRYKQTLVFLDVDSQNTQRLVLTAGYDLQDIIKSGKETGMSRTLEFIQDNVGDLDTENLSLLQSGFNYIPEGLLNEFSDNFDTLGEMLNIDFDSVKNINTDSIGDILDTTDDAIQNYLDDNVGDLIRQFSN